MGGVVGGEVGGVAEDLVEDELGGGLGHLVWKGVGGELVGETADTKVISLVLGNTLGSEVK